MHVKLVLFVFALVMSASVALAAEVEVAPDGRLRAVGQEEWQRIDVTVTPEALAYGDDVWQEAYRNPWKPMPVKTHREHETDGWFHITVTTISDTAVVYNKAERLIKSVKVESISVEKQPNWFIILIGIAALVMIVSNVLFLFWRDSRGNVATFAFVVAAIAATFVAIAFSSFSAATAATATADGVAAIVAAFAFLVAAIVAALNAGDARVYRVASGVFYILIVLSVILFYVYV